MSTHWGKDVLKRLRLRVGMTQESLAAKMGMSVAWLAKQEAKSAFIGQPQMHPSTLLKLAGALGVMPAELGGAKVDEGAEMPPPASVPLGLVAEVRKIEARAPSDAWLGKELPPPGTRVKRIPGGNEIGAGPAKSPSDSPDRDWDDEGQFMPGELWAFDPFAFWIRVGGDSMWPDFQRGDVVVGSPMLQEQIEGGDAVCVKFTAESRFGGGRMLKYLYKIDDEKYELRSKNPLVPPIEVHPTDIEWMGPVVVHIAFPGKRAGWDLTGVPKRGREPGSPPARAEDVSQLHPRYENESQVSEADSAKPTHLPPGVPQVLHGALLKGAGLPPDGRRVPRPSARRKGAGKSKP